MYQGVKSVEKYYQELEVALTRSGIEEDQEVTMARFLRGLNAKIRDSVEMYPYLDIIDLYNNALKIEKQLKRKGASRSNFRGGSSLGSSWRNTTSRKEDKAQ